MLYGKILYHSTFGSFTILSDDYYIRKIEFGKHPLPDNAVWQENHPLLQEAERQMKEYFSGKRKTFSLQLAPDGTQFQKAVWAFPDLPLPKHDMPYFDSFRLSQQFFHKKEVVPYTTSHPLNMFISRPSAISYQVQSR